MLMRQLNLHNREATALFFNYKEQLGDPCTGPASCSALITCPLLNQCSAGVRVCVHACAHSFIFLVTFSFFATWFQETNCVYGSHLAERCATLRMLGKVQLVWYFLRWDKEGRTLYCIYSKRFHSDLSWKGTNPAIANLWQIGYVINRL